jgi:hypothetical protein
VAAVRQSVMGLSSVEQHVCFLARRWRCREEARPLDNAGLVHGVTDVRRLLDVSRSRQRLRVAMADPRGYAAALRLSVAWL